MTLKKNILNVFLVIMMVLCLTSCKSSKLMIEEININQLEKLIENKEDFIQCHLVKRYLTFMSLTYK